MDKAKQYIVWLDGFLQACGSTPTTEQTAIIREKLNDVFEHEDKVKPTLEQLGEVHNFTVHNSNIPNLGRDEDGTVYRC